MLSRVTTAARHVDLLVSLLVLACGFCLSDAREWRNVNTSCPQLERCHCLLTKQGATTLCRNVSQFQELGPDIARLQDVIVKKLTFDHVQMSELPAGWFSNHTILTLVVSNCPLRDIGEAAITGMGRLLRLILEKDRLESVPSGVSAATRLRVLQIRKNRIKFLRGVLQLPALIEFDLRFNAIETIDEKYLSASPNLVYLLLSGNRIQHLPHRLFEKTTKLKEVEFRDNRITVISNLFDGLRYLQTLDLSHNMITNIEMLLKSEMPDLQIINLEGSRLGVVTEFTPSYEAIEVLLLCDSGITEVELGAFMSLENMIRLNLNNNSISHLDESVFSKDSKLEFLALSDNRLTSVTGTFNRTRRVRELKLSSNQIHDITDAFKGLTLLRKLSMRNNLVTYIQDDAFSDNSELAEINLSENKIRWMGRNALKGLVTLNKLLLQDNQLLSLNGSIRNVPQIRYLDASFNAIQSLGKAEFTNNGRLSFIKLTANNISSVRGAFTGASEMVTLVLGKNRVEMLRRRDFPRRMPAKPTFTLDVLVAMSLAVSATYLRYQRELKVWLYARGCLLQCIKEDELDEEKLFDVFLSFSSRDANWVHAQLLPGVEALGFSVCSYHRNFKGGFLLQDVIRDAVACSRRTLLLLTQNFVESEWCRLEFRLAYQRALEDHVNRLVIVLVDEVAPDTTDEDLRVYVRAANYLRWGEPNFWDKLLYSLPMKDDKKKLITHREPGYPVSPVAPTD